MDIITLAATGLNDENYYSFSRDELRAYAREAIMLVWRKTYALDSLVSNELIPMEGGSADEPEDMVIVDVRAVADSHGRELAPVMTQVLRRAPELHTLRRNGSTLTVTPVVTVAEAYLDAEVIHFDAVGRHASWLITPYIKKEAYAKDMEASADAMTAATFYANEFQRRLSSERRKDRREYR